MAWAAGGLDPDKIGAPMRDIAKLTLITTCMMVSVMLSDSEALARNFRLSTNGYQATWLLTQLSFSAAGATVSCSVTLGGSFTNATFSKRAGLHIADVTRARLESCTGGGVTVPAETLPWTMVYQSFSGTLPDPTGAKIQVWGASFAIDPEGLLPLCLARTTREHPFVAEIEILITLTLGSIVPDPSAKIPLAGSFLCSFEEGTVRGQGSVTSEAGAFVFVTLI